MIALSLFICTSLACQLLTGTWINELGSVADIRASLKTGDLSGHYTSTVGSASGPYALVGSFQRGACHPTFGFSVTWQSATGGDSNSTTAWSGVLVNGTLFTTWLLTSAVDSSADVWRATRIGTDVFYRT